MRNPFYHRQAVADPSHVFGRASLVRQLFDLIDSGQSCAVVGERRIGKSTLLAYLASPTIQAAHGLDPDRLLTGELDFLALHGLSPDELWPEILEALSHDAVDAELRAELENQADASTLRFVTFRRALRRLHRRGYRVALYCDELELAVNNPQFDEGFFGALRSLAGEGVVFVTASRGSLLELEQYRSEEIRRKVLASPFFNIFAEFSLGPFEDHEVAEWLAASLDATSIRFDAFDITWLDHEAGRHPFFLQLAAYHLFAELERTGLGRHIHSRLEVSGRASDRGVRRQECRLRAAENLRREGAKIFRHQWRYSRDDERMMLATLTGSSCDEEPWVPKTGDESGSGSKAQEFRTLKRLERRGLVRSRGPSLAGQRPSFRVFSRPFRNWLSGRVTVRALIDGKSPLSAGSTASLGEQKAYGLSLVSLAEASSDQRFQVLEELGHGGTATVYKAWDLRLERLVALKILDADLRVAPDRLQALLSEARTCAGLRHPNIVVVHDIDPEQGFLVEEFLPGGSLRDLFERDPVLGSAELYQVAVELSSALDAAHGAGIVHGDIKPDNILLTERPVVHETAVDRRLPTLKLTDFGTAVRSAGGSREAQVAGPTLCGTLAYMAPEQLAGRVPTPAADVYAFGMVMWEAYAGELPREGSEQTRLGRESVFRRLLLSCLSPDLESRPANGGAIMAKIKAWGGVD